MKVLSFFILLFSTFGVLPTTCDVRYMAYWNSSKKKKISKDDTLFVCKHISFAPS